MKRHLDGKFRQFTRLLSVALSGFLALVVFNSSALAADLSGSRPGVFPDIIPLPNGFQPEGIVTGYGDTFYAGSLNNGAIFQGSYRTGEGEILIPGVEGRVTVGLSFDRRSGYLFAGGGPTGRALVFDTRAGELVAEYELTAPGTGFINDVVVTREAAYFTDSFQPVFYRIPLGPRGRLPDASEVEAIPLSGDYEFIPGGFNANGIDALPNGKWLVIVHSSLGTLYRVDTETGEAATIDLGGGSVPSGDGILLQGRTLYVVQNFLNQIAVVSLNPRLTQGEVVTTLTNPDFRIPTTVASFGRALYAVNARFDVPTPGPDTEYEIVRVLKR